MHESSERSGVKVCFNLTQKDTDGWPPVDVESVWAKPLGERRFVICNVPFYVRDIAFNDVVEAAPRPSSDSLYDFIRVISRGGHSTYRIIRCAKDEATFQKQLHDLT